MEAKLKIEPYGETQFQYKVWRKETLAVSEGFTRKADAERGFGDLTDAVLLISFDRGELIDALERTGLLSKINAAL